MVERVEFVLYWDCDGALIKKNQIPVKKYTLYISFKKFKKVKARCTLKPLVKLTLLDTKTPFTYNTIKFNSKIFVKKLLCIKHFDKSYR